MSDSDPRQVKILFPFEHGAESMWADEIGVNRYRLDNVPLFVYGISYGDEFEAQPVDEHLTFEKLLKRSGHSTYRVILRETMYTDPNVATLIARAAEHAEITSSYGAGHHAFSVIDAQRPALEETLEYGRECNFWDWELSAAAEDALDP